jgi:glycosyltransferase involved in cell wall biosynthesis
MKILFVNPTKLIKRPVKELMILLKDRGYDVRLLKPGSSYKTVNIGGGSEQPLPGIGFFKQVRNDLRWADVIHMWVPYYLTNLYIILVKKIFFPKKKLILTMDTLPGVSFSMGKMDFLFKVYNKLFGWLIFKTPDAITLYGESLRPFALKAGVPEDKIKILSTGVFIPIKNDGKGSVVSLLMNADAKFERVKGRILYAGLMVKRKGISKIMNISKLLPDLKFILIGEGPEKKRYDKYYYESIPFIGRLFCRVVNIGYFRHTLRHRFGGNVHYLGWSNRMKDEYDMADVFLLPSDGEGLPGVVMEAMSRGVPCVASNIPCIPDLIDNGVNGYLCDKDNIEEFAMRIKELTDDEQKRKKFGRAAKKKMNKFDWNKIIKKYEVLYAAGQCMRCGRMLSFNDANNFYWCNHCGKVYEE